MATTEDAAEPSDGPKPPILGQPNAEPTAFVARNYYLGIITGTLGTVGDAVLSPALVLSGYVYELTRSSALVGVLVALASAGMLWPQLPASSFVEGGHRKLPFYRWLMLPRLLALAALAVVMATAGVEYHWWTLTTIFAAYFLFMTTRGTGSAPFYAVVAETIRPTKLGGFFAWTSLAGDSCAVVTGFFVVQPLLHSASFPSNYVWLAAIGLVAFGVSGAVFSFARERPQASRVPSRSFRATLAVGAAELRASSNYRKLLVLRLLFRVNVLALAFYVPYGVERLGAIGLGGVLIGSTSASRIASSLLWARLSERRGNRLCLVWAGVGFALAPVGALIAPTLPTVFSVALGGSFVMDLPMLVYLLALALVGLSMQGNEIGTPSFLIESAPEDRKASYMAYLSFISFPLTALPAAVGVLVASGLLSFEAMFGAIALSGLVTLFTATRLREVRGVPTAVTLHPAREPAAD